MTTPTVPDERIAALVARVHGVEATCRACGVRSHVDRATVETRRLLLNGRDAQFGLCNTCAALPTGSDSHRAVVATLLDLSRDDRAIATARVELFADQPDAHPDHPNARAWGHVSRKRLAKEVAKQRAVIDAESAHVCRYCGIGRSRKWWTHPHGWACADCRDLFTDADRVWLPDDVALDIAATAIAGLGSGGGRSRRIGLGRQVGMRFFTGGQPNERRWGHLDTSDWPARINPAPQFTSLEALESHDWWTEQQKRDRSPKPPGYQGPMGKLRRLVVDDRTGEPRWEAVRA